MLIGGIKTRLPARTITISMGFQTVDAEKLGACPECSWNGHLVYHASPEDCPRIQRDKALFAEFVTWDALSDEALTVVEQEN